MTDDLLDAPKGEVLLGDVGTPAPSADHPEQIRRMTTVADLQEKLPGILARLLNDGGRWILIADFGEGLRSYVQFLATPDMSLSGECVSNDSAPGILTVDQEKNLPLLGWEHPEPPTRPNWSFTDKPTDGSAGARRVIRTLNETFRCQPNDAVLVKLFRSTMTANDPSPEARIPGPWDPIPPLMIADWKTAGFDATSACAWHAVGYQPAAAKALVACGATPNDAEGWAARGWTAEVMSRIVTRSNLDQFRAGRWDHLLEHWNPGSVGYMVDTGFSLEETERWVAAGLTSPDLIAKTLAAGGTTDQAAHLVSAGLPPQAVPSALHAGIDESRAREWAELALDEQTLESLLRNNADPKLIRSLLAAGLATTQLRDLPLSQLTKDEAIAWSLPPLRWPPRAFIDIGVRSPAEARLWEGCGLGPSAIEGFVRAGVEPGDALSWVRAGFTDEDIAELLAQGVTPSPRNRGKWTDAFSRSSVGPHAFALKQRVTAELSRRFWYAVDTLTITTSYQGGMYSSSTRDWDFADGGVRDVDPYGFGTPGGTWIYGNAALRLLCGRIGLQQPRRLKGEDTQPDIARLEQAWADQLTTPTKRSSVADASRSTVAQPWDPADGVLGASGFTRAQADAIAEAGMSTEEALAWRASGVDASSVDLLVGFSHDAIDPWLHLGIDVYDARRLATAGADPQDGAALLQAGCPSGCVAEFILKGLGPADFEAFRDAGVDPDLARVLVASGIGPNEGSRWQKLGFKTWDAAPFLAAGGNLAQAERLLSLGVTLGDLGGWARSAIPIAECEPWIRLGVPPATAGELRQRGITASAAAPQWRVGRHRASTIAAALADASKAVAPSR